MSTRAIIAVELADGAVIASNITCDGGEDLSVKLRSHYPAYDKALGLVVLGDLMSIDCEGNITPSPVAAKHKLYDDLDALDAGKLANANHVQLFRGGEWEHLLNDEGQFQNWLGDETDAQVELVD